MLPIYFVIGLINIFSQHHNYGIDIKDPDFDIRVRRSIGEVTKQKLFNSHKTEETNLNRQKRYAYYKKIRISNDDVSRHINDNNNNGNQSTRNNGNRYDIFNPNWNFLINATKTSRNNSIVNQPINKRPVINSYPYGYPSGYEPKTRSATGSNGITTTTGYRNQDNNTPYFYNYQNPDGRNFAGFVGRASNISGQAVTSVPYGSRYSTRANNNNTLVPYPPSNTQKPLTNISINNLSNSYSTTNNSGIHNLPYATNPVNGIHNNDFNSTRMPFVKDNLSPYAPNWNNGTPNFENGPANINSAPVDFNNGSLNIENGSPNLNNGTLNFDNGSPNFNNGSYAPVNNTNTTVTTTEKIVSGCVICNIPCPQFMRRLGRFCMPTDVDDDY